MYAELTPVVDRKKVVQIKIQTFEVEFTALILMKAKLLFGFVIQTVKNQQHVLCQS